MNSKRRIFILTLLLVTGASAFLFAKARLDNGARYVIYARRGEVTAVPHNPIQGRIVLTAVNSTITHFPVRGKPTKVDARTFFADWPDFDPKASITFQHHDEDIHLELLLSKPYYNRASQLMSFDVEAKTSLVSYNEIHEVNLYIHE